MLSWLRGLVAALIGWWLGPQPEPVIDEGADPELDNLSPSEVWP